MLIYKSSDFSSRDTLLIYPIGYNVSYPSKPVSKKDNSCIVF